MFKKLSFLFTFLFAMMIASPAMATGGVDAPEMGTDAVSTPDGVDAVLPTVVVTPPAEDKEGSAGEDGESTDAELVEQGKEVVSLFKSQEWALAISAALMFLVAVARRFKVVARVPSSAVPWVAASLGVAASVGEALSSGGDITVERVLTGLLAGMAASGMWSLLGRHLPLLSALAPRDGSEKVS